jgi:hypothetical protein
MALSGKASAQAGAILVEVSIDGLRPDRGVDDLRLHVLLSEGCVFALGASGAAFHYDVVRGGLTPPEGALAGDVDPAGRIQLRAKLADIQKQVEDSWESRRTIDQATMKPIFIDLAQVRAVAFVQDARTHRVLAAKAIPIDREEAQR